jgi:hypothetical protein
MSPEDNPAAEVERQFNSGRPKEPPRPEAETFSINTAAELSLYLIMCLPEESDRLQRVRDFVRLYHIEEKRPVEPRLRAEPTWSDEQRKALDEEQRILRGLGRITQPEPKR